MKGVLFSIFFLFLNFSFCGVVQTRTLSPYEKELNKIKMNLEGVPNHLKLLASWLISERLERKEEIARMEDRHAEEIGKMADRHAEKIRRMANKIGKMEKQEEAFEVERMKLLYRRAIEDVENEFPKETDKDFDRKKVKYNFKILKTKAGYDYQEERRRQKWLHYARNPPNEVMTKIVEGAKLSGITEEELASGIAKAHRRLSQVIHDKQIDVENIKDPVKYFDSRKIVLSLRAVLKEADIMDEYLPKI